MKGMITLVVIVILIGGFVGVCSMCNRHEVTVKSTDQILNLEDDWNTTDWDSVTTYWEE